MAKFKLLQIVAISATFTLVGCANTDVTDEGAGNISTDPIKEVVAPVEVEEVEQAAMADADVVDTMAEEMSELSLPEVNVIYFDFDKSTIRSEFRAVLDLHAEYLSANENANVILEGHADERGTREYNLALGERRAAAVASYLKLRGVSTAQFELVSFGEEKPVALGSTSEDYAKNRRVEFKYQ